jgi:hypothetical protein
MYQVDARFETPSGGARLWRYMDVAHLIAVIRSGALYFAHRNQFDDPWESSFPESYKRVAYGPDNPPGLLAPKDLELHSLLARISCWFEGEHESVAMWRLYAPGTSGVAIKTTVDRLIAAVSEEKLTVTIGRVRYLDYDRGDFGGDFGSHPLDPTFWKGPGYVHEREVRAVIQDPHGYLQSLAAGGPGLALSQEGVSVPIRDFTELFERIVVSKNYPRFAVGALQEVLYDAKVHVRVEPSDLQRWPSVWPSGW